MSRKSSGSSIVREASHAGSWYSHNQATLSRQLQGWLDEADAKLDGGPVRGVICPHAGYRYSGPTAAYSYAKLATAADRVNRVFVLGPSHKLSSASCLLTKAGTIATPVGNIAVDRDVVKELMETGMFDELNLRDDENEHSLEMQFPYIAHIFKE
jgi:AmmeMemoRadiSam system protein B